MIILTAEQIANLFQEIASEIESDASDCRNDAAKEAMYAIAHILAHRVDWKHITKD